MKIKVQELTAEAFSPYGTFVNPRAGHGDGEIAFQPDKLLYHPGGETASLCTICMRYRPLVLKPTEYHEYCEEVFGGFNCDVVFHVGLLDKDCEPDLNSIKVFRLPAGWYARVKRYVLHHAGFVLDKDDTAYGIVLLSPSAYTIDCKVLEFGQSIDVEL
jgi:hypothetical protein